MAQPSDILHFILWEKSLRNAMCGGFRMFCSIPSCWNFNFSNAPRIAANSYGIWRSCVLLLIMECSAGGYHFEWAEVPAHIALSGDDRRRESVSRRQLHEQQKQVITWRIHTKYAM